MTASNAQRQSMVSLRGGAVPTEQAAQPRPCTVWCCIVPICKGDDAGDDEGEAPGDDDDMFGDSSISLLS